MEKFQSLFLAAIAESTDPGGLLELFPTASAGTFEVGVFYVLVGYAQAVVYISVTTSLSISVRFFPAHVGDDVVLNPQEYLIPALDVSRLPLGVCREAGLIVKKHIRGLEK
jgi:hypothetical protein